jgi:hypothetical protein
MIKDYNIPTDPRSPVRQFFLDTFLGLSAPAAIRRSLRKVKIETVMIRGGAIPHRWETCLVVPLCEDLGKSSGLYLRGESGRECVIHRKGARTMTGFLCRKASTGFRTVHGFEALITEGSSLSVAGKQYTLVFKP